MQTLNTAGLFLVSSLFDIYLMILALRIILVFVRSDFYNPLSQLVIKLTQFLVNPLRRIIPNVAHVELSCLVIFFIFEIVKFYLICLMTSGEPHVIGLLLLALADGVKHFLNIFFYAILAVAILSWIHATYSPIMNILIKISSPVLRPFQRLIPPVAGFDISPIPAMLVLQLLIIFITPLYAIGSQLAMGVG